MKLFQYVIFWTPTADQAKEGKKPEILKELTTILQKDEQAANIVAARSIPDEYIGQLDQVTVALRPF